MDDELAEIVAEVGIEAVAEKDVEFVEVVRFADELETVPEARAAEIVEEVFVVICETVADGRAEVAVPFAVIFDDTELL